jgi:hypothetical protein
MPAALPGFLLAAMRRRSVIEIRRKAATAITVTVPDPATPAWWLHLVLIYFKRRYLNSPASPELCTRRPVSTDLLDCDHAGQRA